MITRLGFLKALLALPLAGCATAKTRTPCRNTMIQYAKAKPLRGMSPRFMHPYGETETITQTQLAVKHGRVCVFMSDSTFGRVRHTPAQVRGMVERGELMWFGAQPGKSLRSEAMIDHEVERLLYWQDMTLGRGSV